jgi:hypothetical protein
MAMLGPYRESNRCSRDPRAGSCGVDVGEPISALFWAGRAIGARQGTARLEGRLTMVWRSGRFQSFVILDGVLTAGLAALVGLLVATFIHKDWTISGGWWDVFGVILGIGVIGVIQRFAHNNLDSMLAPGGEPDDERIRRLLREILDERSGAA